MYGINQKIIDLISHIEIEFDIGEKKLPSYDYSNLINSIQSNIYVIDNHQNLVYSFVHLFSVKITTIDCAVASFNQINFIN